MQSDFDDLRFTKSDGETLIDAWLESKINDTSAIVWVEFPTTPVNTVTEDYYMYYGKVVGNIWNGENTFIIFDNFEVAGAGSWATTYGSPDYDSIRKAKSPIHSMEFLNVGYEGAKISQTASDNIAIDYSSYLDYLNRTDGPCMVFFDHGNGSKRIYVTTRNDQNLRYYDGSYHDTGINVTLDVWKEISLYNINWSAGTFDIEYDGNTANCNMRTQIIHANEFYTDIYNAGIYIDDYRVRKYTANPATYGFSGEESAPSGYPYWYYNLLKRRN